MMSLKDLIEGISPLPTADKVVREKITAEAYSIGWQGMHDQLAKIDPVSATRINVNDSQRITRAIEVLNFLEKR